MKTPMIQLHLHNIYEDCTKYLTLHNAYYYYFLDNIISIYWMQFFTSCTVFKSVGKLLAVKIVWLLTPINVHTV